MNVIRYDRGSLAKPVKLPNGYMRVEGNIARTGLLEYAKADGTKWVEYRPPEEAFRADTLASFALAPLTNDHPATGMLDAENTKLFQVGTVEAPRRDGDFVTAGILVTDADTIRDMESGKRELSCGYHCDVDPTPGEIDGQRYDAVQRNVVGNHVALVREGRAGPQVRVRMDGLRMEIVDLLKSDAGQEKDQPTMTKIKLDGVDFEMTETAAQAVTKALETAAAHVDSSKAETEKQSARADKAEADAKALAAELAAAPEKFKADLAARTALEASARKVLGPDSRFDGKSDDEVRRAVVESTGVKLDGKSADYVAAAFDIAVEKADSEPGILGEKPTGTELRADAEEKTDKQDDSYEAHQAAYFKRNREAYKVRSNQ